MKMNNNSCALVPYKNIMQDAYNHYLWKRSCEVTSRMENQIITDIYLPLIALADLFKRWDQNESNKQRQADRNRD